nr:hypothetical protein [Candidatus Sigynarchaeum springense]MDO8116122.1 hypothetical protein [Candidatus Sigynarchaeota archaeon]
MHRIPAGASIWVDVAQQLNRALHDSLALCEPWFGPGSLILSPCRLRFKVYAINDTRQGLLKLFEMFRIDKHVLRDAIANDRIEACFQQFAGKSPFLKTTSDVSTGIAAFHSCADNICIDPVAATATGVAFSQVIATIHEKLVPVLVENMPVTEFIKRFDKPYTVFYIPKISEDVAGLLETVGTAMNRLQGCFLIEASDASELNNALAPYLKNIRLASVGSVAFPARLDRAERLFIIRQSA